MLETKQRDKIRFVTTYTFNTKKGRKETDTLSLYVVYANIVC